MARTIALHSLFGSEQLQFAKLRGDEALSQVSEFELDALSPSPELDARRLLGTDVTIAIETQHGGTRHFNALVTSFACMGADNATERLYRYRASLRSWLWLADRNADYRIFQGKSVPDIVRQVLADYPFPLEMTLLERYPVRPYVVQYGESDLNFISRLCEDEGIYHYCKHGADRHSIMFTDYRHDELPNHPAIRLLAPAQRAELDEECIFDWHSALAVQAGRYVTDSYDFTQPRVRQRQQNIESKEHRHDNLEVFEWSGAYTGCAQGERLALVRRQQQQLDHHVIRASSNVRAIAPGYVFNLSEHPRKADNIAYLIIGAHYQFEENRAHSGAGGDGTAWHTDFDVKPACAQYRPPRRAARPQVIGPQTAVVSGPADREIWTNEYGQVKVHFHWDRHGPNDETVHAGSGYRAALPALAGASRWCRASARKSWSSTCTATPTCRSLPAASTTSPSNRPLSARSARCRATRHWPASGARSTMATATISCCSTIPKAKSAPSSNPSTPTRQHAAEPGFPQPPAQWWQRRSAR